MASTIDIELGCAKDESSSHSHDTQSDGPRRHSKFLLGKEIFLNDDAEKRILWAQRALGVFALFSLLCYIIGWSTRSHFVLLLAIVSAVIALLCFGLLYYKNISLALVKRLLKEPNVIIIVSLSLCNWAIEIGIPNDSFAVLFGFLYTLIISAFLSFDAVISKSQYMVLGVGVIFVSLNLYNLYGNTLGDWNTGIVLLEYTIQGKKYSIMKRSTKRSIYFQVLLFSASGIYIMLKDKSMKLMIFATGNVYRSTGMASEDLER